MTEQEQAAYLEQGFTQDQVDEIDEGQKEGVDVSVYAKKEFLAIQMHQIRLGLLDRLPVECYASTKYDWFQMEEIRYGLLDDVDVTKYAKPEISYDRMKQIRIGLKEGIDLSQYAKLEPGILRELRKAVKSKVNIVTYIYQGYDDEQLEQIRMALEKGVDIVPYIRKEFRGVSLAEIRQGLEEGLEVACYAKVEYGWQQMREIRLGLEDRADVSEYTNPLYNWKQMREIRLGLENGLDVSSYKSFVYTAEDMYHKRLALLAEVSGKDKQDEPEEQADYSKFSISISADEMEAHIFVFDGKNIEKEEILNALQESHIVKGIDQQQVDMIASGKFKVKAALIAKGRPSEEGKDGWYEYFFRTKLNNQPKQLPDGSVDYREVEWFECVKKGQKLAVYHEAEYGTSGYTVTGQELPVRRGKEQSVLVGSGFELLPDEKTYIASRTGRITLDGQRMVIDEMLTVDEVSLATGNIKFDGNIMVNGNISPGAVVEATKDVFVNGFVEAADIRSGGSVFLRQGVNGSGTGRIRAGKDVVGRFFEACTVNAGNDIYASYCLNCTVSAGNKIKVAGKSGMLAGGVTYARKELDVQYAGNRGGIYTLIRLGMDEALERRLAGYRARIEEGKKELSIFRNAYRDFQEKYPPEVRNTMELYLKLENAIYTKEKEVLNLTRLHRELELNIKNMEDAEAIIRNTIYEGTIIQINGKYWKAKELQSVRVRRVEDRVAVFNNLR